MQYTSYLKYVTNEQYNVTFECNLNVTVLKKVKNMEISSENFMELTITDVYNMLLQDISKNDKDQVGALLYGCDEDGRRYKLSVVLAYDE